MTVWILKTVFIVFPLFPFTSAASEKSTSENCGASAAVQCLKYSEAYMTIPSELQHTECMNAKKSVRCLEELLARCSLLLESEEELYTQIEQQVASFKEEAVETCAGDVNKSSTVAVMMPLFLGLLVISSNVLI